MFFRSNHVNCFNLATVCCVILISKLIKIGLKTKNLNHSKIIFSSIVFLYLKCFLYFQQSNVFPFYRYSLVGLAFWYFIGNLTGGWSAPTINLNSLLPPMSYWKQQKQRAPIRFLLVTPHMWWLIMKNFVAYFLRKVLTKKWAIFIL